MFNIHIETDDKRGHLIFGQALIDYANEVKPEALPDRVPPPPETIADGTNAPDTALTPVHTNPPPPVVDRLDGTAERLDANGVAFDSEYCGKSKDPFYVAGSREGQWKKKRGLAIEAYDTWYAAQALQARAAAPLSPAPEPPNVAGAFIEAGGGQAPAPPDVPPVVPLVPVPDTTEVPTDAGSLMVWVSEMQTAGRLTQADVDNAYAISGFSPSDLFTGVEGAAVGLYTVLSANLK